MLVVVEHRDIKLFFQRFFNLKAAGSGNVLQIDAAEAGGDIFYGLNNLIRLLGVQADRYGVHVPKFFEEHALSLHDRHGRQCSDVSKSQNRTAVRYDRYRV